MGGATKKLNYNERERIMEVGGAIEQIRDGE